MKSTDTDDLQIGFMMLIGRMMGNRDIIGLYSLLLNMSVAVRVINLCNEGIRGSRKLAIRIDR